MHLTLLHVKFFHSNQIIRYVGNIYKITNHQRYAYIVKQEKYKSKNGIIKETQIIFGIFFFYTFFTRRSWRRRQRSAVDRLGQLKGIRVLLDYFAPGGRNYDNLHCFGWNLNTINFLNSLSCKNKMIFLHSLKTLTSDSLDV